MTPRHGRTRPRQGASLSATACSCGYGAADLNELNEHFGAAFIPGDDIAPDGTLHAELAHDGGIPDPLRLTCACGFASGERAAMDEHLLAAFTPGDRIGLDGQPHVATR